MVFLKSLQIKLMLSMVFVALVSMSIVHHIYRIWIITSIEDRISSRLEMALYAYDPKADASASKVYDLYGQMIPIARRFDLGGIGLVRSKDRYLTINVGLPFNYETFINLMEKNQGGNFDSPGVVTKTSDGQNLVGILRTTHPDGNIAYLIVTSPLESVENAKDSLSLIMWITFSGCLIITLLLSYLLRNTVTRPLKRLTNAMKVISKGDLSATVNMDVDNELRDLTSSFNMMVAELAQHRASILEYQSSLQDKISEIRKELVSKEAELIRAAKLASVGELAAGVAHELNNPLHHLLLTADLALEDAASDREKKRLESMITQIRRCRVIVEDLLEYSRTGIDKPESFCVQALIEEIVKQYREQHITNGAEISVQISDNPPQICGTKDELRRVFANIILNAIQSIEGSDGMVSISISHDGSSELTVVIEDNGSGMDEKVRERIFEPFFTTKEVGKGTGLGLAIAYGIITRHHGRINVESEAGKGTKFTIVLPANRAECQ
ncbi:MAG: HAMP domain-containing histidine kinase [Planctomycetes bacterium]|nr:HAMP domain-containing histidine kinase [Planctomycetota bacterium]